MKHPILNIALKWTWVLLGAMIFLTLIQYVIGFENLIGGLSIIIQLIWYSMIITIFVLSNNDYRKNHLNGYLKYKQALGLGLLIGFFSSLLFSLFYYVFYQFIDNDSFVKTMEFVIDNISKNDKIPSEMKENMLMDLITQTPLSTSIRNFWVSNVINLIFMLIIAAFTKKKNNTFDETFKDVM